MDSNDPRRWSKAQLEAVRKVVEAETNRRSKPRRHRKSPRNSNPPHQFGVWKIPPRTIIRTGGLVAFKDEDDE